MTNNKSPIYLSMVFIIGLLISNVALAIALPPSPHFTHLLNNIPELNKALIKDPDLLSNTRLTDITLKGVVLKKWHHKKYPLA